MLNFVKSFWKCNSKETKIIKVKEVLLNFNYKMLKKYLYLFEMRENYKYSLKFRQFALKTC